MAMEDEYDPFDADGQGYVPDTPGYQASKGTAASTLGYTSDQVYGGGGGEGDDNNQYIARPGAGLTKTQFEKTYGITNRNPFGNRPMSGIGKFFDKLNRAFGGKGIDYSQQFRDLDRFMGRSPGESAARFRQRQYDLYKNPKIADDGRLISGGIDRAGRGTFQGPVEEIDRQMGTGEQLVRAGLGSVPFAGPFLSDLGKGEELYLSDRVTPEMRERENLSLAETFLGGLSVNDTIESLGERLQNLAFGKEKPAQASVSSRPAMGSRDPSREIGPLAQTIPTPIATPIAVEEANPQGPMMPAESDPRLDDNTTANMLSVPFPTAIPEDISARRAASTIESSFDDPLFNLPTPIGRRFDSPVTEIDTVTSRPMDEIDTISFQSLFPSEVLDSTAAKPPELVNAPNVGLSRQDFPRNAPNVGLNPSKPEDTFTVQDLFPELRNAPNLGFERDFGPRTPDDLRAIGIEPSVQDLIDMGLTPSEILQENLKRSKPQASTGQAQVAELDYPELSKISEIARQLSTGEGLGGSTKIFGGDLGVKLGPDGIGFQFTKELQDKDLGLAELLSFLNRRT